MSGVISNYAILIDANNTIVDSLPTGTRRANTSELSESYKIIIGKAPAMAPTPFCNGISGLQFFALPGVANFNGRFVIIGKRVVDDVSVPTYWGCTNIATLVAQCQVLNGGSNEFTVAMIDYYLDEDTALTTNCKLFLDNYGYALSDNEDSSFLDSYFA
jgi:hypothetical protein